MTFYFNPKEIVKRKTTRSEGPKRRTDFRNCTTCKHYVECPKFDVKSFDYICNQFETPPYLSSEEDYLGMVGKDVVHAELEQEAQALSNIELMINQAITDQEQGIISDFVLEDQDIPQPKNIIDFYFNPEFETNNKPFPKQIEILTDLFSEVCYNPKCTDVTYAECVPIDASIDQLQERVTYLEHGVCPKCKETRIDMWTKYGKRKAKTMAGCIGQRSGKDWTMGFGFAYQDHMLLKIRDPGKAYGLGSKSMLYKTFTAIDFGQALKATFLPYVDFIENSKWFKQYHEMLDHAGKKQGKKLYNIGKEAITWNYHGIASLVQSPDVRGLRGVARVGYSITEVAYFYSKTKNAVKLDIEGIMEALINSTAGVLAGWNRNIEQGNFSVPPPLEMLASSPRSKKDQIMVLLKQAERDKSIVARHYNTYQFNPKIKEGDLESFKRDMAKYRASILCLPADAVNAFIPDKRLLLNCINKDRPNGVITKNMITESGSRARLTSVSVKPLFKNVDTKSPKVMFLDGGHKNNSFALCVAHVVTDEDKGREVSYTVVDILLEVIPSDARPADYAHILEEVIIPICDTYNVQYVVADRYAGTIYHLQELQKMDIETGVRSIKYADFLRFKQGLFEATLDLPRLEVDDPKKIFDLGQNNYPISFNGKPVSHLVQQAITVEDLMGKKVDKGEGFTDDLFYALVGAYTICNDEDLREQFLGGTEEIFNDQVLGVSVNYGGVKQSVEVSGGASINSDYDMGVKIGYREI